MRNFTFFKCEKMVIAQPQGQSHSGIAIIYQGVLNPAAWSERPTPVSSKMIPGVTHSLTEWSHGYWSLEYDGTTIAFSRNVEALSEYANFARGTAIYGIDDSIYTHAHDNMIVMQILPSMGKIKIENIVVLGPHQVECTSVYLPVDKVKEHIDGLQKAIDMLNIANNAAKLL